MQKMEVNSTGMENVQIVVVEEKASKYVLKVWV